MRSRRVRWIAALASALAGALSAFCGAVAQQETDPDALEVYGNRVTFEIAPVLLAADRLYDGPVSVAMGGVQNLHGEEGPAGFSSPGVADLATNAETQGLRYSVAHPDVRMIMTVAEGRYRLVARRSAGVASLEDLEGKRVATIPNTSSGYFLHAMLATVGLADDDVTVVPIVPLAGMPAALASGEVDAVTIWEPEMENAVAAIGEDAIVFGGEGVYRELFNLYATTSALEDPETRARIVAFVSALLEASRRINADGSIVWPLVAESSGYDVALVEKAWEHHAFPGGLAPDLLDVLEEEEIWLAASADRPARTREELAALIDPSVLEEARRR